MKEKSRPLIDYIDKVQKDVTLNMRGVLVDWLVEVAEEYKLLSDTLTSLSPTSTDSCLFRLLIGKSFSFWEFLLCLLPPKQHLFLFFFVFFCLHLFWLMYAFFCRKYEEITPPNVEDFFYITDNTYTKQEIVKMEADILLALQFELGNPTTNTFLRRFTRVAKISIAKHVRV